MEAKTSVIKMMNQELIKLDQFDGSNFGRWQDKAKFLLTALKIVYILNCGPLLEPDDNAKEESRNRDKTGETELYSKVNYVDATSGKSFHALQVKKEDNMFKRNTNHNKNKKKSKCHVCGKKGHYARECRHRKSGKGAIGESANMFEENLVAMATEINMTDSSSSSGWWFDSGAVTHICKDRTLFKTYEELPNNQEDKAEDIENPKPWFSAIEKSNKMSKEELEVLIQEYPLPEGYLLEFQGYKSQPTTEQNFENTGKPIPNNLTKHILSHIKLRGGLSIDEPLLEQQLEYGKIILGKPIPPGLSILPPPPVAPSTSSTETAPLGLLHLINPIFVLQMYACKAHMLSRFKMARDVVAIEAQEKRDVVKQASEATLHAKKMSKREADHFTHIKALERRLERAKKKVVEA
ncbi:hypothetical protein RJ639_010922 [Escallonia herrerae]|uniref:CCHC-type domain-containing protein n=1 Tax=Escallonia herrerae TaxID=1293975 RepID=A0AA89APK8_9ASTE|nr:hypothetical protein RJ639_010922 [Escallonia herrerae]